MLGRASRALSARTGVPFVKALTFHGVADVRLESVPDPELELPGDALVRVERSAICGSDLHVVHGRERGLDAGTVLGHEFLGTILEVGAEVGRFRRGDRVVSPFSTSCGACLTCRRGLTSRCERGQLFGWVEAGEGLQGAQAELVRVPLADSTLLEVPPDASVDLALLAGDVLATGFFCAEAGGLGPGDSACVLGCGPIGLVSVLAAYELGAETVFAVDSVPERLALAERHGARAIPLELDDPVERIRAATDGRGVDVVLEAVGSPAAARLALEVVRPGGTISAAGVHTEEHFAFSPTEAYDKNLTYRTGRCPARAYAPRMLSWGMKKADELAAIISHHLPLTQGVRAYEIFDRKLEGCTKVVLAPQQVE